MLQTQKFYYKPAVILNLNVQPLQSNLNQKVKQAYKIAHLQLIDLPQIFSMCMNEFLHNSSSFFERVRFNLKVFELFVPKLLFPSYFGHDILGAKFEDDGTVIGFCDLSLQTNDGTLDTLTLTSLMQRLAFYPTAKLDYYICNLLVHPRFRKQGDPCILVLNYKSHLFILLGFASTLMSACERFVSQRHPFNSHSRLHLHVESHQRPALALYKKLGFREVSRIAGLQHDYIFMRKIIIGPLMKLNITLPSISH
jgi:ribosomal protein S18 acetylase RimI-like enzyme